MIPFCKENAVLSAILKDKPEVDSPNEDYAFHLKTAPVPTSDPWFLRLLPLALRTRIKARQAARAAQAYEEKLIAIWETSPHLLDDIGVVLATDSAVPDHLVAAPARVIDHVKATTAIKPLPAPEAVEAPAAAPVPEAPARGQKAPAATPAGLPA